MDYGTVIRWVHARLSFVILCATLLCVRGSHTKWRALGFVDGMSIAIAFVLVFFVGSPWFSSMCDCYLSYIWLCDLAIIIIIKYAINSLYKNADYGVDYFRACLW